MNELDEGQEETEVHKTKLNKRVEHLSKRAHLRTTKENEDFIRHSAHIRLFSFHLSNAWGVSMQTHR
jgi:hypothetical protein